MSDSDPTTTDLTEFSIKQEVAGVEREFAFLNTIDRGAFIRIFRKAKKDALLVNMKAAAEASGVPLDQESVINTLQDYDEEPPDKQDPDAWVKWLMEDDGQLAAIRISLAKTYPKEADAIVAKVDFDARAMSYVIFKIFGKFVVSKTIDSPDASTAPKTTDTSTYGDGGTDPNAGKPEPTTYTPAA